MIKKQFYSWEELIKDCLILARKLKSKKFDFIVAISRGGLMPATLLAYLLKVKKVNTISYSHYLADGVTGKLKLVLPAHTDVKDSRVLLVDDKTDTGETLLSAKKFLERRNNRIITAVLHLNPKSIIKPDSITAQTL